MRQNDEHETQALSHLGKAVTASLTIEEYDASVKKLLADKQLIARILKWTTSEFCDMDPEDIIPYIEEPAVSSVGVDPGLTNELVTGLPTESKVLKEGLVTYDVRFFVKNPKSDKVGEVRMIVDIEAQKKPNPGYQLVPRGILYCGRMLSEQIDRNVKHGNYDSLEKVYSIWIIFNCSQETSNTISSYEIQHRATYGECEDYERCDLLRVVTVRMPKRGGLMTAKNPPSDLHELLYDVFVEKRKPADKIKFLKEKYGLVMDSYKQEVNVMCNLGEGLIEVTREDDLDEFKRALALHRSGEMDKDVYREEGISEEVISMVFDE
ncbi:MAG: hypothetical protein IJJ74_00190 [Eubacterium sp.]|nr:hypothetical protein [Eubacterium sp.]